MTLFDVLTVKAKEHMATYLKKVDCEDDCEDEWDHWWDEFVNGDVSWIETLTPENLSELKDVNEDYCNLYRSPYACGNGRRPNPDIELNVSVAEMLMRYKLWKCDPDDWKNYSVLENMFEEQWKELGYEN